MEDSHGSAFRAIFANSCPSSNIGDFLGLYEQQIIYFFPQK